jgi:hypothetical protein
VCYPLLLQAPPLASVSDAHGWAGKFGQVALLTPATARANSYHVTFVDPLSARLCAGVSINIPSFGTIHFTGGSPQADSATRVSLGAEVTATLATRLAAAPIPPPSISLLSLNLMPAMSLTAKIDQIVIPRPQNLINEVGPDNVARDLAVDLDSDDIINCPDTDVAAVIPPSAKTDEKDADVEGNTGCEENADADADADADFDADADADVTSMEGTGQDEGEKVEFCPQKDGEEDMDVSGPADKNEGDEGVDATGHGGKLDSTTPPISSEGKKARTT